MDKNALVVSFYGNQLIIINNNGEPYTPMKPIVEGMGLDWKGQHAKISACKARWGMEMISIPSGGALQEMVCLPLRKLFGWMQGIHPNKVNPEIREKVIQYQNECDEVLYEHWRRKIAVPQITHKVIQDAVYQISPDRQNVRADIYRRLKQHFGVSKVTDIPADQCSAAADYVRAIEGDYIGKPVVLNAADTGKVTNAYALAAEVASVASRTVFESVLAGNESMKTDRWLFCMSHDPAGRALPYAAPIDRRSFIATFERLPGMILEGDGLLPSNQELAALATACSQKLAQRLGSSLLRG